MDDSILTELTKCFSMLANKHDGTFLKLWSEEGNIKFHLSNNNVRQTSFQHSTFSHHPISTPKQKLEEKVDETRVLRDEKGVLNEDGEPEEHPQNDVDEQRDEEQGREEQPEGKKTEVVEQQERVTLQDCSVDVRPPESDKSMVNVNQYGYPEKGHFKQAIFSYCKDVIIIEYAYRGPTIYKVQCCSLCKIHANNSLKYVCVKHSDSAWHEWTTDCEKINPTYDLTYLEPI